MAAASDDTALSRFETMAGAQYGVAGMVCLASDGARPDELPSFQVALSTWHLVSEALARHDDEASAWQWLDAQLIEMGAAHPWFVAHLRRLHSSSWVTGLLLALCPDGERRRRLWTGFIDWAGAPDSETAALRHLVHALLSSAGTGLFTQDTGSDAPAERYGLEGPAATAIVRLGRLLGGLEASEEIDASFRGLYHEWRMALRGVLPRLAALERITRGFAGQWPVFEDAVLAIVQTAEWLERPEWYQMSEAYRDLRNRPLEALTSEQLVFIGLLLGAQLGYRKTSYWVQDHALRKLLSRQAMALVANWHPQSVSAQSIGDPVVFYSTASGTRSAFLSSCISERSLELTTRAAAGGPMDLFDPVAGRLHARLLGVLELDLTFHAPPGASPSAVSSAAGEVPGSRVRHSAGFA